MKIPSRKYWMILASIGVPISLAGCQDQIVIEYEEEDFRCNSIIGGKEYACYTLDEDDDYIFIDKQFIDASKRGILNGTFLDKKFASMYPRLDLNDGKLLISRGAGFEDDDDSYSG